MAWCNLGTVVLVLAAALDLQLVALWLLGCTGCALAFGRDGGGRWKPMLGPLFQLGLLFLGLAILKSGAAPLRDASVVQDVMALADHALLPPFAVGIGLSLIAQSSTTVTILAIALSDVGLLDGGQAGMAVCGASLGSGLSVMLLAGGLHGAARRLATFQALFKALGAVLLAVPLVVWRLVPALPDPFAAPGPLAAIDLPHQLGLLFVALQLLPALLLLPAYPWLPRLLERLSPATREEALARPKYLYDQALENAPTALDLAGREQARLLGRLPGLLDPVREEGRPPELSRAALASASAAVERAVAIFLQEVLARGCPREELERAVALENLNSLLTALRETASDLAAGLEAALCREAEDPVRALASPLAEALHLLLSELAEAALSGDPADSTMLAELAADRSDMMDGLRRRISRASAEMPPDGLNLLFRITTLFERAVWLIRRSALLLSPAKDDRQARAPAPLRAQEGAVPVHLPG